MNPADFFVLALVAAACGTAIFFYFKGKKSGKTCSCGCSGCSYQDSCKKPEKQ